MNRLRTPFGKPNSTFRAIEGNKLNKIFYGFFFIIIIVII